MTLKEMELEFQFKYDSASSGAPDLNSYEISLCLTQAARDLIKASYLNYEKNEVSRRIVNPFLENKQFINPSEVTNNFTDFKEYHLDYSDVDYLYRVRDKVKLSNCTLAPKVEVMRKDNYQEYLNNPFKQPNKRKVLREDKDNKTVIILSSEALERYEITFIVRDKPIIIRDFQDDPTLMGDETIEGLNTESQTLIPELFHDKIVDRAVQLAILYSRENGLSNIIQVQ